MRFARELRSVFLGVRRIAIQLRNHATHAPYLAVGVELRQLADRADGQAAVIAEQLRAVAANLDSADPLAPREGRNHWERLTVDLADLAELKRNCTELALRWDVEFPAAAATIAEIGSVLGEMSASVRALVARSDPHAD